MFKLRYYQKDTLDLLLETNTNVIGFPDNGDSIIIKGEVYKAISHEFVYDYDKKEAVIEFDIE